VVASGAGRPAVTRFEGLGLYGRGGGAVSLVRAVPESGRTNQIRVHASHAGYPIVGDKVYGVPEEIAAEYVERGETERVRAAAGAPRQLLHCRGLRFRHPGEDRAIELRASPPGDFAAAWPAGLPAAVS
jgi:23S rRNA-/tRNA-specific pseudouridylate synthase